MDHHCDASLHNYMKYILLLFLDSIPSQQCYCVPLDRYIRSYISDEPLGSGHCASKVSDNPNRAAALILVRTVYIKSQAATYTCRPKIPRILLCIGVSPRKRLIRQVIASSVVIQSILRNAEQLTLSLVKSTTHAQRRPETISARSTT